MQHARKDRLYGLVFGQAIGDALGLGTEFMTKAEVMHHYPQGLSRYQQIIRDEHRSRWQAGEWTDDTSQMLCILDSLLQHRTVNVRDIAKRLYHWAALGGAGLGNTTFQVLYLPQFLLDPHDAAREVWEASGRYLAANGGVMRTAILGVWDYQHPEEVRHHAEQVCKITHYDPRCVGSCVLVSLAVSALMRGESDVGKVFGQAGEWANGYDPRIATYLSLADHPSPAMLGLDEGLDLSRGELGSVGYTLKALGAGFWALKHASSYMDGIRQIIHEGGDADTNAAVAGALLGARFGYARMPHKLAYWLAGRQELEQRLARLVDLLDSR